MNNLNLMTEGAPLSRLFFCFARFVAADGCRIFGLAKVDRAVSRPSKTVGLALVAVCRLTYGVRSAQRMLIKQGLPTVLAMFEQLMQPDLVTMAERYPTNLAQEAAR